MTTFILKDELAELKESNKREMFQDALEDLTYLTKKVASEILHLYKMQEQIEDIRTNLLKVIG